MIGLSLSLAQGRSAAVTSAAIGPAAAWNGTGGSGGSAPTQNTRTVAQITAAFTVVPGQRVNEGTFSLRVKADPADLGVTFSGDCVTTTVTTPKLVFVPTVHGTTRHEYVYEILLDINAFLAKSASTNTAWIYANCQSSDPNMCNRVLGPFILYPESSANDGTATGVWSKTFSLGGVAADYTSLSAAITACSTALAGGKTAALLTCVETGAYTATNLGTNTMPARGYATITHAPGVTCTIGRTSVSNYNDETTWWWTPGLRGVEFRGSGIVFDNAYYSFERWSNSVGSKGIWYNGCRWTDSLGRDRLWNGQSHPGRGPSGANIGVVLAYFTDTIFEDGVSPHLRSAAGSLCIGVQSDSTYGDLYTTVPLVTSTYDTNSDSGWFRSTPNAITIQYSGANTATIEKNSAGANGGYGANNTVVLRENGTIVATLTPQQYASQANTPTNLYWSWAEMATCINALSGWTATVNDTTGRQARYSYGAVGASGLNANYWNATDCKTSAFVMRSLVDVHGDWYQSNVAGNVIIANCVVTGATNDYNCVLFLGNEIDTLVENFIGNASYASATVFSAASTHFRMRHCTLGQGSGLTINAGWNSAYSQIANIAINTVGSSSPNNPAIINNYTAAGSFGAGTGTTGNFTGSTWALQFEDTSGSVNDFRPRAASAVKTTLVSNLASCPYDIMGNLRSATDCAGAVSKNQASATVFPMTI